jgi:hypothetical protein
MPAFEAYAQVMNSYCRRNVLFPNTLTLYLVAGVSLCHFSGDRPLTGTERFYKNGRHQFAESDSEVGSASKLTSGIFRKWLQNV